MKLNRGDVLFHQGETGALYQLKEGLIKIIRIKEDGTTTLVNLILPGEIFPHHSLMNRNEYFGTAIVVIPCKVEMIPSDIWYHELESNPERLKEIALVLQEKLRMMQQRIDQLTTVKPVERFELAEKWFKRYFPDLFLEDVLNQEEIGQFIGLRRETVNRLLKKLRGDGK
ncbi:Crp/Fnr family transcriptional regulator [Caldalkalibacillus mannanilyticus]|uniref:Crp/Fnr family transcriptional regulator n=1 Tax=Caldalkalibacillus mannanilyticus TaxID=1418 RepID=UPI00046950C3|nr:Crp/Fnr family transcriptional regulator [Caldalkalibacillus mannanilyticus]